jgi:hypothetical protein
MVVFCEGAGGGGEEELQDPGDEDPPEQPQQQPRPSSQQETKGDHDLEIKGQSSHSLHLMLLEYQLLLSSLYGS